MNTTLIGLHEAETTYQATSSSRSLKRKCSSAGAALDLEKQLILCTRDESQRQDARQETYLYLAYGSNLAKATFEGVRGVKPLSAVNVHVPVLEMAFDLPGIAYTEPCFANTRRRQQGHGSVEGILYEPVYHDAENLGWSKGLVGVVYEVTAADYKHIIETEGGGASYADILIPCYPLPADSKTVPDPDSYTSESAVTRTKLEYVSATIPEPFLAHTLLAAPPSGSSHSVRRPGWAQPSLRYLGLLRTGAQEHRLPLEYADWLDSLQAYQITSRKQEIGAKVFQGLWGPIVLGLLGLGKVVADDKGRAPKWYACLLAFLLNLVWWSYDMVFYPIAGDGERTEGT